MMRKNSKKDYYDYLLFKMIKAIYKWIGKVKTWKET